jgi:hypothetical protein
MAQSIVAHAVTDQVQRLPTPVAIRKAVDVVIKNAQRSSHGEAGLAGGFAIVKIIDIGQWNRAAAVPGRPSEREDVCINAVEIQDDCGAFQRIGEAIAESMNVNQGGTATFSHVLTQFVEDVPAAAPLIGRDQLLGRHIQRACRNLGLAH